MNFRFQTVLSAAALSGVACASAMAQSASSTQLALASLDSITYQSGGATPTTPAATASTASATDPRPGAPKTTLFEICGAPLELQLDVGVWLPRLRGNVTYGGAGSVNLDLSNALALNSMETSFIGNLSATWKNWTIRATGTSFSTSGAMAAPTSGFFGSTLFLTGEMLVNSFSYWTWGIETESWLWRPFSKQAFPWLEPVDNESLPVDMRFFAVVGGRGFGISQSLTDTPTNTTSTFNGTFGTIYGGGGLEIRFDTHEAICFIRRVDVYGGIEAGPVWPGSGGLFMQIDAGATAWFTDNVGLYFDYVNLRQNVNTNSYNLQSYIGGFSFGLSVKF
ncbi:MAG: hypothetical protein K8R92_08400 [Planctomycetes bacterium]|nr:hypothetical protein [Planctomycetota bacterium]